MITTKRQMYELYCAGAFGNRTRQWDSFAHYLQEGAPCPVNVRDRAPGGRFTFAVGFSLAELERECWTRREGNYVLGEATPDHALTLNAELVLDPHWKLWHSFAPVTMRRALREHALWAEGLSARLICQSCMDPSSWADLGELIDSYPGHAIEFSCYSRHVGVIPCRNTVFWEVRAY